MIISYIYDTFRGVSKKTNEEQDFYVVRLAVLDKGKVVRKSQPLIWLDKEQYDLLKSNVPSSK